MGKTVQSVERALDILLSLSEADSGLGVYEVANMLGVANPTAHSLLQTLVARNFACQRGTRYYLGGEIQHLFENYVGSNTSLRIQESMLELSGLYPQGIIGFSELQLNEIVIRFRISPDRPGIIQKPIGHRYALYHSLSAITFLAFLPQDSAARLRRVHPFDEYGLSRWKSEEEFEVTLKAIKKDGYFALPGSDNLAYRITTPVWDIKKNLTGVMSLSVTWQADSDAPSANDKKKMIDDLLAAAQNPFMA